MSDDVTRVKPARRPGAVTVIGEAPQTVDDWPHPDHWGRDDRPPVDIGTVIRDRFELESVIGEGSMGVVYRALDRLHLEMQDRDPYVAIKILSEEFKRHPNALIVLQREVRKAQTLAHENIIGVHSFDRDGAIVYMTMELLDGASLRTLVTESVSGLPAAEVVPMVHGMAKALAYAHENGIVHSDFKPGNVFLTRKGQIKVLDFGVARGSTARRQSEVDTAFDLGEIEGMTPAYASPQMLQGQDPAPADDVFALAIVAYELLTGRHPFDYEPPNEARLRALKLKSLPDLSRAQRRALARAFAHDRESRPASAAEFLEEFARSSTVRAAAQTGVAAAAVLGMIAFASMRDAQLEPGVPFESLPADVRARFDDAVAEGETALGFGAAGINDALLYFSRAYELHPNNPRAVAGLETVADRFLASVRTADAGTQRDVFDLLYCQERLARYQPVAATCGELLGPACEAIARGCGVTPTD